MKERSYIPDYQYSIDEFVDHFDHFAGSPEGTNKGALIHYFADHYQNHSEACYKMNRFGMAFAYMMRHLRDFEQFVVVGEEGRALVAKPLVVALARYFGPIPEQYLDAEPDAERILELAREEA